MCKICWQSVRLRGLEEEEHYLCLRENLNQFNLNHSWPMILVLCHHYALMTKTFFNSIMCDMYQYLSTSWQNCSHFLQIQDRDTVSQSYKWVDECVVYPSPNDSQVRPSLSNCDGTLKNSYALVNGFEIENHILPAPPQMKRIQHLLLTS